MPSAMKIIRYFWRNGVSGTIMEIARRAKFMLQPPEAVKHLRARLAKQIANRTKYTIVAGPFKGLKLSKETNYSAGDLAPQIFVIYEKEVLDVICASAENGRTFIDIGAANDYYVVGVIKAGLFPRTIAFETEESR